MEVYNRLVSFAQGMMGKNITLGVCAMDKKARSKPMKEILSRLPELFEVIIFGDECILSHPVETWPNVECLITFASSGFPTAKALDYIALRKPFLVNDLAMTEVLGDRRRVYEMLLLQGIDVPKHVVLNRDERAQERVNVVEEFDEYVLINGVQINKPLVEKPVDAEDHNIYIYYPVSAGGGSKRLFRKVGDRSSEFYPHVNELRAEGSFIYEEFVITQGTDVKVYTVGPEYGHAEARKSPVVDGRVNRDHTGREVRYPVILSHEEKDIIKKIVTAFKQTVCGFDILRVRGRSYVCDVNGWSFVKNSRKYYDDASKVLAEYMLSALRPRIKRDYRSRIRRSLLVRQGSRSLIADPERGTPSSVGSIESTDVSSVSVPNEELRCVIAVLRHGDRTPKQKIKVVVKEERYIAYFHQYSKSPRKDLKVKSKTALVKFLEVTREIIDKDGRELNIDLRRKLWHVRDVLERWEISGINRKLQMKPVQWEEVADDSGELKSRATEIQMILKWGGDLTPLGRDQAEKVGAAFRHQMYPDSGNGGVLRLHSTYRHDLKIRASDEGRVMKTAAAFTKGLLELEGPLTPILASLVTVEERDRQMLDKGGNSRIQEDMDRCKAYLEENLQQNVEFDDELVTTLFPHCASSVRAALQRLGNPRQTLARIHKLIDGLCLQIEVLCRENGEWDNFSSVAGEESTTEHAVESAPECTLHLNETFSLMLDRWEKLNKDFRNKKTMSYDLTKVPDVYDMVRYDVLHNSHVGLTGIEELLRLARDFADVVVPQEYGISREEKVSIGYKMCGSLIEKLRDDLEIAMSDGTSDMHFALDHAHADEMQINSPERNVRTRLYFTSESHLHTLLNILRFSNNGDAMLSPEGLAIVDSAAELSYLTQIVIRLFETEVEGGPSVFRCEISFTPGATNEPITDKSSNLSPYVKLNASVSGAEIIRVLGEANSQLMTSSAEESLIDIPRLSSVDTSGSIPSGRYKCKRVNEVVVLSNNSFDTSDLWEDPGSPVVRSKKSLLRRLSTSSSSDIRPSNSKSPKANAKATLLTMSSSLSSLKDVGG